MVVVELDLLLVVVELDLLLIVAALDLPLVVVELDLPLVVTGWYLLLPQLLTKIGSLSSQAVELSEVVLDVLLVHRSRFFAARSALTAEVVGRSRTTRSGIMYTTMSVYCGAKWLINY